MRRNDGLEKKLVVIQLNCNGISNKLSEVKLYIYAKKPDMVCLCETWLKKAEPKFVGYTSIWKNRVSAEKGRLDILIRNDIAYKDKIIHPYVDGGLEIQSVAIFSKVDEISICR